MTLQDNDDVRADAGAETVPDAKPRAESVIDAVAATVTITGVGKFGLPVVHADQFALAGFRAWLMRQDDPTAAYAALTSGKIGVGTRAPAKPKALRPWQEAAAQAMADAAAKAQGIKRGQFGKETPEFGRILGDARAKAAAMNRDALAKVRQLPAVVAHHHRIVGGDDGAILALMA